MSSRENVKPVRVMQGKLPWSVVAHEYELRTGEHLNGDQAKRIAKLAMAKLRRQLVEGLSSAA